MKKSKYGFETVGKQGRKYLPVEPMDYVLIRSAAKSYSRRKGEWYRTKLIRTGYGCFEWELWVYFGKDVPVTKD